MLLVLHMKCEIFPQTGKTNGRTPQPKRMRPPNKWKQKDRKKGKLWVYWPWARLNDFLTKWMQSLSKWANTDVLLGLCSKLPGIPHKSMSYSAVGTILCGRNTRISYESGVHPEYHASGHQSMHKTPREAFWVGCAATQRPFMVKQTRTYGMCLSPLGPTHTPP